MKYSYLIFSIFVCITLSSCTQQTICPEDPLLQQSNSAIELELDSIMDDWHDAAAQADFNRYMDIMDSNSIFIGTDATENWSKNEFSAFSKPYFDKGQAWDFKALERNIYVDKYARLAWFDELLDTWMGTCRGSGILQYNGNDWKIKHYVLSIEIPNENVRQVIEAKQSGDSLFLHNFHQMSR